MSHQGNIKRKARAPKSTAASSSDAGFAVYIADNFQAFCDDEPYPLGRYATYEAAAAAAAEHVNATLRTQVEPGMSVRQLLETYQAFGDAPYVRPPPSSGKSFSAHVHAASVAEAIIAAKQKPVGLS